MKIKIGSHVILTIDGIKAIAKTKDNMILIADGKITIGIDKNIDGVG